MILAAIGGVAWIARGVGARVEEEPEPALAADLEARLAALPTKFPRGEAEVWTVSAPLRTGGRRIGSPFRPQAGEPLDALFLMATAPGSDLMRGRTLGRPVHAVRIEGQLYLDLVAAKALPDGVHPLRTEGLEISGSVEVGACVRFGEEVLPGEEIGWTREELLELASMGHRLEQAEVDILPMVQAAFADRCIPLPGAGDDEGALTAAAVLNWAGVVVRREDPWASLGYFGAGLEVCGEGHEDNRGDLHFNRGEARRRVDDRAGALRDYTMATGLLPHDPDPWVRIAMLRLQAGDRPGASEAWLQAATRTKDFPVQQVFLANAESLT